MTSLSLLTPGATTVDDDIPVPTTAFDMAAFLVAYDAVAATNKRLRLGTAGGLLVEVVSAGAPAAAVPARAVQVAGSDGTNLRALATDAAGNLKTSQPTPVQVATNATAAWANSAAASTAVNVPLTQPTWHASANALWVLVANPSQVTQIGVSVQDSDGTNWYTRSTYSGALSITIGAASGLVPVQRASLLIDGGMHPLGTRLQLTNLTVLGVADGFSATVNAHQK